MNYRERYRLACQKAFDGFFPDLAKCRKPDMVLRVLALARDGYYSKEIAETLETTPKAVQKVFRRYSFPNLHNLEPPLREERVGWSGGVKIVKGYHYSRTPGHPYASKHGNYVAVHRLVTEEKLGRYLLPTEVVDHIDGNPGNNHPDNLRVFASNGEHLRVTLAGRCPKWSEDGRAAILSAVRKSNRNRKGQKKGPSSRSP